MHVLFSIFKIFFRIWYKTYKIIVLLKCKKISLLLFFFLFFKIQNYLANAVQMQSYKQVKELLLISFLINIWQYR